MGVNRSRAPWKAHSVPNGPGTAAAPASHPLDPPVLQGSRPILGRIVRLCLVSARGRAGRNRQRA
eukprot:552824-Pyramimonas_sp.AAC.1